MNDSTASETPDPKDPRYWSKRADGKVVVEAEYSTSDYAEFFQTMSDCSHLLVWPPELTWLDTYRRPDRPAKVFMNLSCGTQHTPHLLLDAVSVFETLGVDLVAGAGRQFCCGKVYRGNGHAEAGARMSRASLKRMGSWQPEYALQWCHSCQVTFTHHQQEEIGAGERPSFETVHVSPFLARVMRELGDRIPWKKEVRKRVLLESHALTPVHLEARRAVGEILSMVPGVEIVGDVTAPSLGMPCAIDYEKGTHVSVLSAINADQHLRVHRELQAQADAVGADTISCGAHLCHREWSKFSTEQLDVQFYVSIVAEALGVAHPDRFKALWRLHDAEAVLEQTRPIWNAWGMDEVRARDIARRFFEPRFEHLIPRCACGGDPSKCVEEAELILPESVSP